MAPPEQEPSSSNTPEMCYAASVNEWMESDIFTNYFNKTTFLKFCDSVNKPILLIYDGHSTHIDERVIESAIKNNVTIIKLPPHSSHLLQTMDLAVFKILKSSWDEKLTRYQRHQQGVKMPKWKFSLIIKNVWKETSPDLLKSGFKKAGIYPFNSEVVDKDKYDPDTYRRYLALKNTPT